MPAWLSTILGWLGWQPTPVAAPTATATASASLGLGITSDIGAVAGAVSAGAGLAKQVDAEVNTPAEIAAAIAADKQRRKDEMAIALANNDTATIQRLIAGK